MGPTNYTACAGSGALGGTPFETDGVFYVNSATTYGQITDGSSHTVALSESLLGEDTPRDDKSQFMSPSPQRSYKFVLTFFGPPELTDFRCDNSLSFNSASGNGNDPRGFAWASGEYRSATYNHYYPPNATNYDCITSVTIDPGSQPTRLYAAYGWRSAQSLHPHGVNVLLADGSAHFIAGQISLPAWRALSTRSSADAAGGSGL